MAKTSEIQQALIETGRLRLLLKLLDDSPVEKGGMRFPAVVGLADGDQAAILVSRKGQPRKLLGAALRALKEAKLEDQLPVARLC